MALSKIKANSITDDSITVDQIADTAVHGRRNLLINGNWDHWQRATSFTDVAGIWKYGHADRWNGHNDGTNAGTWSRSTTVPNSGSTYSLLMTGATSVTNTNTSQRIESADLQPVRQANSMTLSGYVRSETAGKVINLHGLCPTAGDNYSSYTQHNNMFSSVTIDGDGTTGTSAITLTSADTWYYFTATKTSATSLTNFQHGFAIFCSVVGQVSSSHKVYFSQFQLEAGTVATPFEFRSPSEELALCQRYYFTNSIGDPDGTLNGGATGIAFDAAEASVCFRFPVTMRQTPTVTLRDNAGNTGRIHRMRSGDHGNAASASLLNRTGFANFSSTGMTTNAGYLAGVEAECEI